MANCCFITLRIDFGNKAEADTCFNWLQAKMKETEEQHPNWAFELGKDTKFYIIDYDAVKLSDDSVEVGGWVKWAIDTDAFVEAVSQLTKNYDIRYLRCDYQESGCNIYGYWEYFQESRHLTDWGLDPQYCEQYWRDHQEEANTDGGYSEIVEHFCNAPVEQYQADYEVCL